MSDTAKLYIAGSGMITPVGGDSETTAAAVKAQISSYKISGYSYASKAITMAAVPNSVFDDIDAEIGEGERYNIRHDRVIKMSIIAIQEACSQQNVKQAVPLILAMPDGPADENDQQLSPLIQNLANNCKPWINVEQSRSIFSGRAAGIEAIEFAFNYLYDLPSNYILIGGSDSYQDDARLDPLGEAGRLLTTNSKDGFAPGEAAGFLLLTRHQQLAQEHNGHIIALNMPGISDESGHLHSEQPYRGDGLDQAFKKALGEKQSNQQQNIHSIYSSMNGENHWAKEYSVASMRNKAAFKESVTVEHPADCYGDLGAATSTVLIALAANNLLKNNQAQQHLVYSSSDYGKRAAIVVEKIAYIKQMDQANQRQPATTLQEGTA